MRAMLGALRTRAEGVLDERQRWRDNRWVAGGVFNTRSPGMRQRWGGLGIRASGGVRARSGFLRSCCAARPCWLWLCAPWPWSQIFSWHVLRAPRLGSKSAAGRAGEKTGVGKWAWRHPVR